MLSFFPKKLFSVRILEPYQHIDSFIYDVTKELWFLKAAIHDKQLGGLLLGEQPRTIAANFIAPSALTVAPNWCQVTEGQDPLADGQPVARVSGRFV
jgi:hypothetical protein